MQGKQPLRTFLDETASVLGSGLAREFEGWIGLAVATLAAAGLLALVAVAARMPGLRELMPWPWQDFFPKIIVTHVDLSIIVWFLSILGGLAVLATARVTQGKPPRWRSLGPLSLALTTIGSVMLVVPVLFNLGEASLNNYVPVLTHPLFYTGLGGLALGITTVVLRFLCNLPGRVIGPFEHGVAATGTTFLVALACLGLAWRALPAGVETALANERLFWGSGHVLQFVNTMLMLVAWHVLSKQAVRETDGGIPPRLFVVALWILAAVALLGVPLYGVFDVLGREHREAFTQLLWHGLALPPTVITVIIFVHLVQNRQHLAWRETPVLALLLSLLLFSAGGILGYFLGVGDTRTPSHYHAVIGGVNLAVMGITFTLFLPLLQRPRSAARAVEWSLLLYGGGQFVFSVGMFAAGIVGVPRKTAGLEQGLDTAAKYVYMVLYGIGGLVAVIGGVLFVWIAVRCLLLRQTGNEQL